MAKTLEARARDATTAAEAAARSSAEAEAKVEEVRKALKAEAGGAGGSLAGGAQVRVALFGVSCISSVHHLEKLSLRASALMGWAGT